MLEPDVTVIRMSIDILSPSLFFPGHAWSSTWNVACPMDKRKACRPGNQRSCVDWQVLPLGSTQEWGGRFARCNPSQTDCRRRTRSFSRQCLCQGSARGNDVKSLLTSSESTCVPCSRCGPVAPTSQWDRQSPVPRAETAFTMVYAASIPSLTLSKRYQAVDNSLDHPVFSQSPPTASALGFMFCTLPLIVLFFTRYLILYRSRSEPRCISHSTSIS